MPRGPCARRGSHRAGTGYARSHMRLWRSIVKNTHIRLLSIQLFLATSAASALPSTWPPAPAASDRTPADTARASSKGLRSYSTNPNDVVACTPHASAAGTQSL